MNQINKRSKLTGLKGVLVPDTMVWRSQQIGTVLAGGHHVISDIYDKYNFRTH